MFNEGGGGRKGQGRGTQGGALRRKPNNVSFYVWIQASF